MLLLFRVQEKKLYSNGHFKIKKREYRRGWVLMYDNDINLLFNNRIVSNNLKSKKIISWETFCANINSKRYS